MKSAVNFSRKKKKNFSRKKKKTLAEKKDTRRYIRYYSRNMLIQKPKYKNHLQTQCLHYLKQLAWPLQKKSMP